MKHILTNMHIIVAQTRICSDYVTRNEDGFFHCKIRVDGSLHLWRHLVVMLDSMIIAS